MGRRAPSTLVLAVLATSGACITDAPGDRVNDVEVRASFSFDVEANGHTLVGIENVNGGVVVRGEGATSLIHIEGHRRVRSDSRTDAEDFLRRVVVEVSEAGPEVWARTSQPDDTDGRDVSVSYEVSMPAGIALVARTVNGGIEVRGTVADAEVRAVNGGLAGELQVPEGGEVVFSTVNGGILVSVPRTTSARLEADVVNGSILVTGLTILDGVVTTTSVRGRLGGGRGLLRLVTTNGGIGLEGR